MRKRFLPLFAALCACAAVRAADDIPAWAQGNTITTLSNDKKYADQFRFSDPAVWKFGTDENGKELLELAYDRKEYKSAYTPKHRSPIHIALLKTPPVTDFVFDVEMMFVPGATTSGLITQLPGSLPRPAGPRELHVGIVSSERYTV